MTLLHFKQYTLLGNISILKLLERVNKEQGDKCHLCNLVGGKDKHNKRPYEHYNTYLYTFYFFQQSCTRTSGYKYLIKTKITLILYLNLS